MGARPHPPRRTGHYRRWAHLGFVFHGCVLAMLTTTMLRQIGSQAPGAAPSSFVGSQPHTKLQGRVSDHRRNRIASGAAQQQDQGSPFYRPASGRSDPSIQAPPSTGLPGAAWSEIGSIETSQSQTSRLETERTQTSSRVTSPPVVAPTAPSPPVTSSNGFLPRPDKFNRAGGARVASIARITPSGEPPTASLQYPSGRAASPGQRIVTLTGEETGQVIPLPARNPTRGSVAKRRRELAARLEAQQRNTADLRSSFKVARIPASIVRPSTATIPAQPVQVIPVRPAPLILAPKTNAASPTNTETGNTETDETKTGETETPKLRPSAAVMNLWAQTQSSKTAALMRNSQPKSATGGGATTGTKGDTTGSGATGSTTTGSTARAANPPLQTSRHLISPPAIAERPRREMASLSDRSSRSAEPQSRRRAATPPLRSETQILLETEQAAAQSAKITPDAASASDDRRNAAASSAASSIAVPTPKPASAPSPDRWSAGEIATALSACKKILATLNVRADAAPPIKRGPCGDPAPIILSGIGSNPVVKISPPATVNCAYAAKLHRWVQLKLQPTARKILGKPITNISTMASYACRNRYGRKKGKLSEHAKANALDIGSFKTADNRIISVQKMWGPLEAEIASARRIAQQIARRRAAKGKSKEATGGRIAGKSLVANASLRRNAADKSRLQKSDGASKFKRGRLRPKDDVNASPQARFLHQVHAKACGIFGTVLGPEANKAHANHLHLDAIKRRNRAFCE